jgi:VIT1/CCC1 family predicted Fe2+/Mn2+ transporter
MAKPAHSETHFSGREFVRDTVIGMADGLTVPFALAAGLTGAVSSTEIIVVAGLAEIAAGSIAMGLGGFLAGKSDAEIYAAEHAREYREVREMPGDEAREVVEVLRAYGLTAEESAPIVASLRKRPQAWVDFMMRFELGLEKPDPRRALRSGATIAGAYVVGGLIPLAPYMLLDTVRPALNASVLLTLVALAVFGYIKGHFGGGSAVRSSWQTVLVGGVAAAAAFALARALS